MNEKTDLPKQTKDEYELQHEYWLNVGKTFLSCQRTLNRLLAKMDLSIAQHEILLTLLRNKQMTHKDLSEQLLVVKSNISNLVKKLVQRELVEVVPNSKDLRVKVLRITDSGKSLVKKSAAVQKRVVSAMIGETSKDDLAATNRVMLSALLSLKKLG